MHGPAVAGHAVAAVEGAGEEHVLGADEDGGFFEVEVPVFGCGINIFAPHEDDYSGTGKGRAGSLAVLFKIGTQAGCLCYFVQPILDLALCLLDKGPHREAINEATRPSVDIACVLFRSSILEDQKIPQPCQRHACGFAKAGGDVDEAGGTWMGGGEPSGGWLVWLVEIAIGFGWWFAASEAALP